MPQNRRRSLSRCVFCFCRVCSACCCRVFRSFWGFRLALRHLGVSAPLPTGRCTAPLGHPPTVVAVTHPRPRCPFQMRLEALKARRQHRQQHRQQQRAASTQGVALSGRLAAMGRRTTEATVQQERVARVNAATTKARRLRANRETRRRKLQLRLVRELRQRQRLVAFSRSVTQVLVDRAHEQAVSEITDMRLAQPTLQRCLPLAPDPWGDIYTDSDSDGTSPSGSGGGGSSSAGSSSDDARPRAPHAPPTGPAVVLSPPALPFADGDDFVVDGPPTCRDGGADGAGGAATLSPVFDVEVSPALPVVASAGPGTSPTALSVIHSTANNFDNASFDSLPSSAYGSVSLPSSRLGAPVQQRLRDVDDNVLGPPPNAKPSRADPPLLQIKKDKYGRTVFPRPSEYVPYCPHSRRRDTLSAPLSRLTLSMNDGPLAADFDPSRLPPSASAAAAGGGATRGLAPVHDGHAAVRAA